MQIQISLQEDIFAKHKVEVTFHSLYEIMTNDNERTEKVQSLMVAVIDKAISKARNVKEKVLNMSQSVGK